MKKMGYVSFVVGVMMLLLLAKGLCYSFENAGTCYWFSTQKKTFYEAEETCENMNGKLAQLHDQAVFEMITDKIVTSRDQFWIGLHFQKKKSEFSIAKGSQEAAETIHCPLTSFRLDGSRLKCAQACIMEPKCLGFVYNKTICTCTMWKMYQSCSDDMRGITVTVVERQCSWNSET